MKINDNSPNYLINLYKINQEKMAGPEKAGKKGALAKDSMQLSDKAKEISRLVKETAKLPEIREEKIAQIKAEINNNTYKIPARDVAAKMLGKE